MTPSNSVNVMFVDSLEPAGIVVMPDGRYAAIAPRGKPVSGVLFVVDVPARKVVGRVSGVGNETYLLALLPAQK